MSSCIDTFIKGNLPGGGWPAGAGGDGAAAGLFDGIDIDWEYPTQVAGGNVNIGPADRHNATLLAAEFRKQLDAYGATTGKHYLLTRLCRRPRARRSTTSSAAISKYLDWDNVMTYDFNVPGGTVAAPDTLFTSRPARPERQGPDLEHRRYGRAITCSTAYRATKIVVGVPFYGNQYLNTGTANHGLYTSFDNTGLDSNSLHRRLGAAADVPRAGRRRR